MKRQCLPRAPSMPSVTSADQDGMQKGDHNLRLAVVTLDEHEQSRCSLDSWEFSKSFSGSRFRLKKVWRNCHTWRFQWNQKNPEHFFNLHIIWFFCEKSLNSSCYLSRLAWGMVSLRIARIYGGSAGRSSQKRAGGRVNSKETSIRDWTAEPPGESEHSSAVTFCGRKWNNDECYLLRNNTRPCLIHLRGDCGVQVKQREDDSQCSKMLLRFREDKIKRLEALSASITPADMYLRQEKECLMNELQLVQAKFDRNPELTRFAIENIRLLEQLRRLLSFWSYNTS